MSIFLEDVKIVPTIFPDKTSQVWHLPKPLLEQVYKEGVCTIKWVFEEEAEFVQVAQLKTLLDTYCPYVNLKMPYLPYARQDKRIDNESTFSLHTFAKLINFLGFARVIVLDSHSNRSSMIERLEDESPTRYIQCAIDATKADLLLFPDAGAKTRYGSRVLFQGGNEDQSLPRISSIWADKVRDQATGRIEKIEIHGSVKNKIVLIVDDIADGGRTFIELAKQALRNESKETHLFVSHGIFSQGVQVLKDAGILRIFTHKGEIFK